MADKKVGDAAIGNYYIYFLKKEGSFDFIVGLFTMVNIPLRKNILSNIKMTKYYTNCADLVSQRHATWKQDFSFTPRGEIVLNVE